MTNEPTATDRVRVAMRGRQSQCGSKPERSDNELGNSPHNMKTSASSSLAAVFALLLCAAVSGFDCAENSSFF